MDETPKDIHEIPKNIPGVSQVVPDVVEVVDDAAAEAPAKAEALELEQYVATVLTIFDRRIERCLGGGKIDLGELRKMRAEAFEAFAKA